MKKGHIEESLMKRSKSYNLSILTTYDCNMCCDYCFEEHANSMKKMGERHIETIINRICSKIEHEKYEKINISFTGGEPLLNYSFIVDFMKRFKTEVVSRFHVEYATSLITNGTMLNDEIITTLSNNNCAGIQITIDGDKERHNISRKLKSSGDSYTAIVGNINAYSKHVPIVVRSNYHCQNEEGLYGFIDDLHDNLDDPRSVQVKFRSIMNVDSSRQVSKNETLINVDKLLSVIEYSKNKGFEVQEGTVCDKCRIHKDSNEFIDVNGDIYRCFMLVGHLDYKVGNIFEEKYVDTKKLFDGLKVWKACLDCKIVSLCGGGCRYEALIDKKDMSSKICNYSTKEQLITGFHSIKYNV